MEPVDRNGQLGEFRQLLADSVDGRGRILLVSGGVGSGKTELLTRCTELAHDAGARVLTATGGWAERELDMALVEQLFHSTELPPATAGRARSLVRAEPAGSGTELTIQQADAKLIQEMCAVLLEIARERPLVIVLDDLQFADRASLQTLLYLQRRIRSVRVLLVFAEVASARPAHPALHDELNRQPGFRHLRLDPLTRAGVGELLARRLGPMVSARLADSCHALTGGSPLLVHALAEDHLAARTAPDADLAVGEAYGRAVLRCLRRGDGQALWVAQGLAVLDEFATPDRLGRLLDLAPTDVGGILSAMADAGLLAEGRFRHPAATAAVLRDLPRERLSALRARAGRLLHADGVGVAAVSRYLTGSATVAEPWALPVLRAGAVEALSRNDVRHAVECLELAGAGRADDRDSAAITAQLVAVQRLVDPAAAARHLTVLVHAFEGGLLADAEAGVLLRALVWQGRTDEAAMVLAKLDGDPCPTTRDWLFYAAPHVLPGSFGDPPDRPGALASVVSDEPAAAAIDGAERVLQSCRIGDTPLEDVLSAVQALNHADRGDRAGYWCDELLAEAAAGGTTVWQAVLSDAAASVSLRRGDLMSARRLARAALDLMPAASWGVAIGSPLAHLLTAATRLGRFDEADELVRQGLSPSVLRTTFGLRFLAARGELHLTAGRLRAALGDFLAVGELAAKWDIDLPVLVPWRQQAAQVYARLDRRAQTAELVAEQLRLPGGSRTRGVPLRVLASVSEPEARLPLLLEAVDLMRERGEWFELALAFTDLSRTYQALGRHDQAKKAARRARQLSSACETPVVPDPEAPVEQRDEAAAVSGAAALSAAERRVANLAALGHTNREISRMLHVTISTVEQHLTRTYRKLNITRRTDLPVPPLRN